jgi:glycosyltransferase involved in cell wall biosynthesis
MRVLLVTTSFPLDNDATSGIFVRRLADALAVCVDVSVLTPDYRHQPQKTSSTYPIYRFRYAPRRWQVLAHEPGGIPVTLKRHPAAWLLMPFFLLAFLISIWKASRDAQLMQANWSVTGLLCGVVGLLRGRPVVTTFRGSDVSKIETSVLDRWIARQSLKLSRHVITVSQPMRDALVQKWPEFGEKIHHIGNGVDPFLLSLPAADITPPLKLITVGNLIKAKGTDTIFEALGGLNKGRYTLTVVGDGPNRPALERQASNLGIADRIKFAGSVPPERVGELLTEHQALIIASRSEGRPNVVVEAMAAGRAVIASDLPGIRELIDQLLFPPGDTKALQAQIQYLIDHPQAIADLGSLSRQVIERLELTWNRCAYQYLALFEQALGR